MIFKKHCYRNSRERTSLRSRTDHTMLMSNFDPRVYYEHVRINTNLTRIDYEHSTITTNITRVDYEYSTIATSTVRSTRAYHELTTCTVRSSRTHHEHIKNFEHAQNFSAGHQPVRTYYDVSRTHYDVSRA